MPWTQFHSGRIGFEKQPKVGLWMVFIIPVVIMATIVIPALLLR